MSGNEGDVYTVGGWAKADSAPITEDSGRMFAIRVNILYNDGSTQTEYIKFNPDVSNWQFASGQVITNSGSYYRIRVDLVYSKNVNKVFFDGIGLYKEQFSQSYTYDDDGNIISVADLAKNRSQFEYNGNNDLTKMITPKGGSYTYNYDNKHNLLKATTAADVEYSFTYDTYGNVTNTKIGNDTKYINSSAEYTADGNYLRKVTDSRGYYIIYDTDPLTGLVDSITDANGNTTNYTYDLMDRLTNVSATNGSSIVTNSLLTMMII